MRTLSMLAGTQKKNDRHGERHAAVPSGQFDRPPIPTQADRYSNAGRCVLSA
jgi:hypothetical protein